MEADVGKIEQDERADGKKGKQKKFFSWVSFFSLI
jgi:hypothetical protein